MPEFATRGLAAVVLALLFATLVIFALCSVPDGDPALRLLGQSQWASDARAMSRDIDQRLPFLIRYLIWLNRLRRYAQAKLHS
jgi:ABC-type dipeptide/oligopeptide/nickel transport system permease component